MKRYDSLAIALLISLLISTCAQVAVTHFMADMTRVGTAAKLSLISPLSKILASIPLAAWVSYDSKKYSWASGLWALVVFLGYYWGLAFYLLSSLIAKKKR